MKFNFFSLFFFVVVIHGTNNFHKMNKNKIYINFFMFRNFYFLIIIGRLDSIPNKIINNIKKLAKN